MGKANLNMYVGRNSAGCVIFSKRFNFTKEILDISPVEFLK